MMNMEQFRKNVAGAALDDSQIESVSGGVAISGQDDSKKYEEFMSACEAMGFEEHGIGPHTLEAWFDEWQSGGYKPASAKEFLSGRKAW